MKAKKNKTSLVFTPPKEFTDENSSESLKVIKENLRINDSVKKVILDFKNVETVDSTGINLIAGLQKELSKNSQELSLKNSDKEISKILKFSGFLDITN